MWCECLQLVGSLGDLGALRCVKMGETCFSNTLCDVTLGHDFEQAHQASSTKELQFRPSPTAKSVDSECLAGTPVVPSDAGAVQNPKTQTPNEPLPHSEERLRAGLAEETIRREELWLRFLAGDDGPVGGESLPPPDLFRS